MREMLSRVLSALLLVGTVALDAHALDCTANAALSGICFADFVPREKSRPDSRIKEWLAEATPAGAPIRSFAFVISIARYPAFPRPDDVLDAVNVDLQRFSEEQQFDEIIVLSDAMRPSITSIRLRLPSGPGAAVPLKLLLPMTVMAPAAGRAWHRRGDASDP